MLTLYGKRGSGSAAAEAALIACRRAVSHRRDGVVGTQRRVRGAARKSIRWGRFPTLVLADGSAIVRKRRHPDAPRPDLSATAACCRTIASARAQALRGLVFIAANCYAAISVIDFPERWCADADNDDAVKERIRAGTRARLHRHWEIFADLFPARPWLGGDELGALDLLAAVVSKWSGARKHLQQKRPTLFATLQRDRRAPESRAGVRTPLAAATTVARL